MTDYLILFLIIFGIHLAPAFTPPTWPVIALYSLSARMPLPLLVVCAAVAAVLGRYALAHASRLLSHRLGGRAHRNVDAACAALKRRKHGKAMLIGLFVLSPIPSAQLFEAAGIARARLLGPTAAYLANRLAFYSLYAVTAYSIGTSSLGAAFQDKLTSPLFIAVQIAVLVVLVILVRLDWTKWLARSKA